MKTHLWIAAVAIAGPLEAAQHAGHGAAGTPRFRPLPEPRAIDGRGNALSDPERGATFTPLARELSTAYADGASAPAGPTRPSARHVSNVACAEIGDLPNARGVSDLFWQWGQFLDHDITETPVHAPAESLPIQVPRGDRWFDPLGTGTVLIPLSRSFAVRDAGRREQVNAITAWIDGSQVYGSDAERARALRTLDGTGRLAVSAGDLLPFNTAGLSNAPSSALSNFFLAGDVRANEQVGLTALHVVFVREHNYWAARIAEESRGASGRGGHASGVHGASSHGGGRTLTEAGFAARGRSALTGDEIYELARAIVSAELQRITYEEWLPLLLGAVALPPEAGYRPELDGTIRNEFATAAFRLGHSMLSGTMLRLDRHGAPIAAGHLSLADAFFAPDEVIAHGIDPVLRGLAGQRAQELDVHIVDEVRNFLFGAPGSGGFDLAALNVQRGRDHGLPSYAQARRDLGLGTPLTMDDVTDDPAVRARLQAAARSPEELDLWVGGLAEDHLPGALVGPTFHALLLRQFVALRDGDRLWHSRQLPPELLKLVAHETLARIVRRNTEIGAELDDTPFILE